MTEQKRTFRRNPWKRLPLKWKVPIQIAVPTVIIALAISVLSYVQARSALEARSEASFSYLMHSKQIVLEAWLEGIEQDVVILGDAQGTVAAIEDSPAPGTN